MKRVLFLGVTGIDKMGTLTRLKDWCEKHRTRECEVIDFDSEWLQKEWVQKDDYFDYLGNDQQAQRKTWNSAWKKCEKRINILSKKKDIFLGVHGCIVRGHYGARIAANIGNLATFKPDCIVTLIDDVYDMWWRTEARAGGVSRKGRPTLEQLVTARRVECLIAEELSHYTKRPIPSLLVSVSHPLETLANYIYSESKKIVYLSFPISAPRLLPDDSGREEIGEFIRKAYSYQKDNPNLVVICPLGIDEMPLIRTIDNDEIRRLSEEERETKTIKFNREQKRWDLNGIWSPNEIMSQGSPPDADRCEMPLLQIQNAYGAIFTDITWRDYRLVGQATSLAGYNPRFRNAKRISRSVQHEILFAIGRKIPCYIYQNEAYDPENLVFGTAFPSDSEEGTMSSSPSALFVHRKKSIDEVFKEILK